MTEEKKKKISFELVLYYPEEMDDDDILDMFAGQIIGAATEISSKDIEIVNVCEGDKIKQKEALTIAEEILRMIAVSQNRFMVDVREYICSELDISDDVLIDTLNVLSSDDVIIGNEDSEDSGDSENSKVNDNYRGGECPDCNEEIPDDIVDGQACGNCGHVFWTNRK